MNLLARAKLSAGKRLFSLTSIQQSNLYSTKTNNDVRLKTQRFTNPSRTLKPSEPSPTFPKHTEAPPVWPKPAEIPYQAKVANFVNLVGFVRAPISFEAAGSDGKKPFATTVISQENPRENISLLIPVLFEGDLAHVVSSHVKENDCVFVTGKLRVDPTTRSGLNDSVGKFYFHIVAENLNFVEGLERNFSGKKSVGVPLNVKPAVDRKVEEVVVVKRVDHDDDFSEKWKSALEHAKVKRFSGENDWASLSSVTPRIDTDLEANMEVIEPKPDKKSNEKSGEGAEKKKDGDPTLELWRDLVKNPLQWWDYRDHKANGLVKEKFPDFKQKGIGESLWLNTAPKWLLPGLDKLEFDVKVMKTKPPVNGGEGFGERKNVGKGEDLWKNLVENPNKWWDNRLDKRNPKAPDFKHKETGEGLWVSNSPDWALSMLPPPKDGQNIGQKFARAL